MTIPKTKQKDEAKKEEVIKKDKAIREGLTEEEVDKMLKDTFPASDPPSTY